MQPGCNPVASVANRVVLGKSRCNRVKIALRAPFATGLDLVQPGWIWCNRVGSGATGLHWLHPSGDGLDFYNENHLENSFQTVFPNPFSKKIACGALFIESV